MKLMKERIKDKLRHNSKNLYGTTWVTVSTIIVSTVPGPFNPFQWILFGIMVVWSILRIHKTYKEWV